jgi:hypothetical protein
MIYALARPPTRPTYFPPRSGSPILLRSRVVRRLGETDLGRMLEPNAQPHAQAIIGSLITEANVGY